MAAYIRRWLHKRDPTLEDAREHGWAFRPDRRYPGYYKQDRIGDPIRPPETAPPELHPINAKAWGFELVTQLPHKHQYTAEAECHHLRILVEGRVQPVRFISYPAFIYEHPQVLCAARRQHTWVVSFKIDPRNGDAILDKKCWGCMRRPTDSDGSSRVCTVKGMRIARSTRRYAAFLLPSMSSTEFFRHGGWPGRRLPRGHPGPGTGQAVDDDDYDDTIQTEEVDSNSDNDDDDNDNGNGGQDHGGSAGAGVTPSGNTGTGSGTRTYSSEPHPRTRPARSSLLPDLRSEPVVGPRRVNGPQSPQEAPRRRHRRSEKDAAQEEEELASLPRGPSDIDGAYDRLRPSPNHTINKRSHRYAGHTRLAINTESKPSAWSLSSRRRELSPAGDNEIVAVEMSSLDFDEIKKLRQGAVRRPRQSNDSIPCSQDV